MESPVEIRFGKWWLDWRLAAGQGVLDYIRMATRAADTRHGKRPHGAEKSVRTAGRGRACGQLQHRQIAWIRGEVFRRFKLYSQHSEAKDFKNFQKQSGHQLWSCATAAKEKLCFRCMVSVEAKIEF